jgi:molybdopterin molybdotransferase
MLSLEDARERILATLPPAKSENVETTAAAGRILAKDVVSPLDLPPFDNSAMDGYALRAADVSAASADNPVALRIIGRIAAGGTFSGEVHPGECVRLFTGSMIPAGADAVVMQEDTRNDSARPNEILICDAAKAGENLRRQGDDVRCRATLAKAGDALTPVRIALLAATGVREVAVGWQPVVGLLATGSELREPGQQLEPGQIYESNRAALAPLIRRVGGVPKVFPLVPDTPQATLSAMQRAFAECDVVITSGGVSVGEMDFVKSAFEQMGGTLDFWKVAIRPGKPFVFGRSGGKFLFGLPGNPVSAFVTFLLLVGPALVRWQGGRNLTLSSRPGVLVEALNNRGDRRHFARVRMDAHGMVYSAGVQASHALTSLAAANGLVDVPPATTWPAETRVEVLSWE